MPAEATISQKQVALASLKAVTDTMTPQELMALLNVGKAVVSTRVKGETGTACYRFEFTNGSIRDQWAEETKFRSLKTA